RHVGTLTRAPSVLGLAARRAWPAGGCKSDTYQTTCPRPGWRGVCSFLISVRATLPGRADGRIRMRSTMAFVAAALLLGTVAVASAQMETGTVVRVDPQSRVVLLDDGRMYRVTPNTMLVVENQPATLGTLVPGQRVMIQSGEVVVLRNGQYVTAAAPAPAVVAQAPAVVTPAPSMAVPVGVRQTIYGTVTDV